MDNNYYNNMNQNQNQSTQNNQNGYNPYNSNSQGQTYQNTSYNAYNPYQQPTGGPAPRKPRQIFARTMMHVIKILQLQQTLNISKKWQ